MNAISSVDVNIPDEKPTQFMTIDKTQEERDESGRILTGSKMPFHANETKYLSTAERAEFPLPGYNNWGLDRLNDKLGVPDGLMLDHKFDDRCFPKQGLGSTIYVIDTGCRVRPFRGF